MANIKRALRDWLGIASIALVVSLLLRAFAFEIFQIPSGSMIPTLLQGDYVFVTKYTYGFGRYSLPFGMIPFHGRVGFRSPQRGDIVVFRNPNHTHIDFIKRLVGMPGDKVEVRGGRLLINDTPVKKTPLETGGRPFLYTEQLPNDNDGDEVFYNVQELALDQGHADNTQVFSVPPRHYFMMGDNRDNSIDSRFTNEIGMVSEDFLIGRAEFVIYSFEENGSFWRFWSWPDTLRTERVFLKLSS